MCPSIGKTKNMVHPIHLQRRRWVPTRSLHLTNAASRMIHPPSSVIFREFRGWRIVDYGRDYGSAIIDYKLPTTDYTSQATDRGRGALNLKVPYSVRSYTYQGGGSSLGILYSVHYNPSTTVRCAWFTCPRSSLLSSIFSVYNCSVIFHKTY
jgi:hypothetical protein